ncbi:MAG TPA: MFS transporter [Humisphaera sp.]|nr:MFS transporter [Humisphaera sp.]
MKSGGFLSLLRSNRNYRFAWTGQVVSEAGDNFNNIAVFSLALANTGSGFVVAAILLSRAISMLPAGPIAGVLLDRMDRRRIMILSDLVRAAVALAFIFAIPRGRTWLLYLLSGLLMFASPFFTSGRAAILPSIATREELHTANALTQLTQWTALAIGSFLGGIAVIGGYHLAFVFNAFSFLFSAACIAQLGIPGGFLPKRAASESLTEARIVRPWHEYVEGLRYLRATPLIFGIGLINVGWASGGGAGQILLSLFGDVVFRRGSVGIGAIWGSAGVGLIIGAIFAHRIFPRLSFKGYKITVSICYIVHGVFYLLFSLSPSFAAAIFFIGASRVAVGVSSVCNSSQLLRHVAHEYRGRVFSTIETWTWMTMMVSMSVAGFASDHASPRVIGTVAAFFSMSTAFWWGWANYAGKLPEPALSGFAPEEVEVHGDPAA